jgi:hypothetical protein
MQFMKIVHAVCSWSKRLCAAPVGPHGYGTVKQEAAVIKAVQEVDGAACSSSLTVHRVDSSFATGAYKFLSG